MTLLLRLLLRQLLMRLELTEPIPRPPPPTPKLSYCGGRGASGGQFRGVAHHPSKSELDGSPPRIKPPRQPPHRTNAHAPHPPKRKHEDLYGSAAEGPAVEEAAAEEAPVAEAADAEEVTVEEVAAAGAVCDPPHQPILRTPPGLSHHWNHSTPTTPNTAGTHPLMPL